MGDWHTPIWQGYCPRECNSNYAETAFPESGGLWDSGSDIDRQDIKQEGR